MARSVETDGQTDMARSTLLVVLIKNIYTLWGRKPCPSLRCKIYGVGNVSFTALQTCGNVSFTALQTSDWETSPSLRCKLLTELYTQVITLSNGFRGRRLFAYASDWNHNTLCKGIKNRSYNLFHLIFPPIFRSFLWQLYDMSSGFDKIKFDIQN